MSGIRPRYIPESSGNPLPKLDRRGSYHAAPVPMASREAEAVRDAPRTLAKVLSARDAPQAAPADLSDSATLEALMLDVIRRQGPINLSDICDTLQMQGHDANWNKCRARLASMASRALICKVGNLGRQRNRWVLAPERDAEPEPEHRAVEDPPENEAEQEAPEAALEADTDANPPEPDLDFGDIWTQPTGATVGFVQRFGEQIVGEYQAHVCPRGVVFEDSTPIPPEVLAVMLPVLRRAHDAVFGGDAQRD